MDYGQFIHDKHVAVLIKMTKDFTTVAVMPAYSSLVKTGKILFEGSYEQCDKFKHAYRMCKNIHNKHVLAQATYHLLNSNEYLSPDESRGGLQLNVYLN